MSTDGRPADATHARPDREQRERLERAAFVRLVTRADGDALAASGILASALRARGTPFQVTVGRTVTRRTKRARSPAEASEDDDLTVVVGAVDADVHRLDSADRPATLAAVDLARQLETDAGPDPILALAGLVAAGVEPGAGESEWLLETARERGLLERRPGLAVPTADPVDGVAHSIRLRAPWSGDPDAARDALAAANVDLDGAADPDTAADADEHRDIASVVALDAVGADDAEAVAAETVQRALRPYATPDGPFETLGGYADVLEAAARVEPGTGAALAMGHDARRPALAAWREYGRAAHGALETASTGRYDGLFVVGIDDGPVEAVARLAVASLSPEPVVLVVGDGEAAIGTRDDGSLAATIEHIARGLEDESESAVEYDVGRRRGYLRYDPDVDESTIIATVRGRL
ncbi:hypothetical protein [Halopiger djelfimassiliensis]|uniref:hypothetical protein n=1 Tax=Halopiger djelfimassiliensis TaxID=1293047 RepID=UPI0006781F96|nr:hypothetical protein [Halopiger djelfimassiliensis]